MKRYIKHLIILVITIASVIPNAFAEVDIARSFYILRNDSAANAFVEGGEWLIEFSNKDTLGYEYDYPVAMNIRGAYYPDTTFVPMQAVDSLQFVQPSTIMKSDVFELTKEHYKYIIDTDLTSTVRFRIDCIAKIDLPKVGQKVISYIYEEPLPLGFLGQVESIKVIYDEGSILMTYKPIKLSDVYDRLYVSSVIGQEAEDTDSVPEVVSRSGSLRPLDYDYNDEIDIVADIPLPLPDVGIIVNWKDFKLEGSSSPKTANTPAKIYAVDNTLGVKIFEAIIIDAANNVDYTETVVEASLESTIGAAVDFTDFATNVVFDGKNPLEHRWSFAPKITNALYLNKGETLGQAGGIAKAFTNMPAAFWRVDWGLMLKLALDVQLKVEDSFKITVKFGYKDTGKLTPVCEVRCPDKLEFNHLNFDFGLATGLNLKAGPYFMAKIGIPSIVDLSTELCMGLNFDGKLSTNPVGVETDDDIDAKESTFTNYKAELKDINKETYFKFQSGLMFDGYVTVLKGYALKESWVDWLRKVDEIDNLLNILLTTWVDYEGVPTYEFSEISNDNAFGGVFTSKKRFMLNHKLGLLFKDASLDDEDPSYVDFRFLNEMTDGKPVHYGFTIFKDDNKHLKGKPLEVYSLIKVKTTDELGKFCSTGKIAEFEFPYESKVSQMIGDDYTYVAVDVEVDPDAAEDEDYTQSGILVWKDGKKEETGIRLIGNENYAVNATIQFDRKMFSDYRNDIKSNMDYCVKPWVYDAKRDRYVYGEQSKFQLKSLVGPKTMPATDITYNSAYLKGNVHEEFFNYIDGDFEIIFSYWIPGETAETVLKYNSSDYPDIATTLAFEALVMGLRPNTEYEYRVGLNYSSDGFFGGEPLKFKTKNVISNLKHEAGTDFAILYADLPTDYIAENCKEIYFEIVENDQDFSSAIAKVADEGDFVINEDGTTTIDVIFYDLTPSIKYKYRMVFVAESGFKLISDVNTFTTESRVLKATTGSATVTGNSVKIKGSLSSDLVELLKSQEIEYVYFNYSKDADMTSCKQVKLKLNSTDYSTTLTNLSYGTIYYYQFYAADLDETLYEGDILSFVTDDAPVENVEECYTLPASVEDANVVMSGGVPSATLNAIQNGVYKNVQYGFEVAESQSELKGTTPTFATKEIDMDTGMFTITKVLQPNTTYYIRAMVFFNDKWVAAPEVVSVKTADFDPGLIPPDIE